MEGTIISREASKVVVVGWTGPYAYASQIRDLWRNFVERVNEIPKRTHTDQYISPCNDRETDFTCYIGVEVDEFTNVPDGLMALTVPAHKYAVFTHCGPMSAVQQTYMDIFQWLGEHGYEKDSHAFSLELYDNRYNVVQSDPESPNNAYDIYVPIK